MVTRGKHGAILLSKKINLLLKACISKNVIDKVGQEMHAIHYFFTYKIGAPKDLSLLLGSFAGSMSVETIGNSVSINKKNFCQIEFSLK